MNRLRGGFATTFASTRKTTTKTPPGLVPLALTPGLGEKLQGYVLDVFNLLFEQYSDNLPVEMSKKNLPNPFEKGLTLNLPINPLKGPNKPPICLIRFLARFLARISTRVCGREKNN